MTWIFDIETETFQLLKECLIVLGIGLLLGLEREYSEGKSEEDKKGKELFAGVRTFPLVALIGYLCRYLADHVSVWIYPVGFAFFFGFVILSYYLHSKKEEKGATTEFAMVVTFLLSSLVFEGEYLLTVFLGLLMMALLAFKIKIHKAIYSLSREDVLSILLFAVITTLILPLLPNKGFGPYEALNPFKIWGVVSIFISLNFVAYFLHKFIGSRYSLIAVGIFGGFASSTATAWYFSRESGKTREGGLTHSAAIILASSIMFPRILIWLLLLNRELLAELWLPILSFGLVSFFIGFYLGKKSLGQKVTDKIRISNPINLKDAGLFAFFYVLILFLVGFAEEQLGNQGIYIASGISGLTDVDAIVISMADYGQQALGISVAAIGVLMAAFSNTIVKYALCLIFGNQNLRKYTSFTFVPLILAGIIYITYKLSAG